MTDCPNRFTLLQWHLGELERGAQALDTHVATCSACTAVIAEYKQQAAYCAGRRDFNLAQIQKRLDSQTAKRAQRRRALGWPLVATLTTATVAVALVVAIIFPQPESQPAQFQYRGALTFKVTAFRGSHRFEVEPQTELRPGDRLKFSISTDAVGEVAFFALERTGNVHALLPAPTADHHGGSIAIGQVGHTPIAGSVSVPKWTDRTLLVVVFSPQPFEHAQVESRLKKMLNTGRFDDGALGHIEDPPYYFDAIAVQLIE